MVWLGWVYLPIRPWTEEIFTMDPESAIFRSSARRQYMMPVRLTARMRCHSSSSRSAMVRVPWCLPMMPAQLAAPSRRPCCATMPSIQLSTSARCDTSTRVVVKGTFRELKCDAAAERAEGSTSAMQTVAPRLERSLAVARPMPDAPPVMAMILSCIDMFGERREGGMEGWRG